MTTPSGHRILVDGGENKLAARYLASRFWDQTAAGDDVHFDAVVVTHGDADHFDGLSTLVLDATTEKRDRKRIRVTASRVFRNGLVKRVSSLAERDRLGAAIDEGGKLFAPLLDDPRTAKDANRPFRRWNKALDELRLRAPLTVSRLDNEASDAFGFLGDVNISVLGPRIRKLRDGTLGLLLLGDEGFFRHLIRADNKWPLETLFIKRLAVSNLRREVQEEAVSKRTHPCSDRAGMKGVVNLAKVGTASCNSRATLDVRADNPLGFLCGGLPQVSWVKHAYSIDARVDGGVGSPCLDNYAPQGALRSPNRVSYLTRSGAIDTVDANSAPVRVVGVSALPGGVAVLLKHQGLLL